MRRLPSAAKAAHQFGCLTAALKALQPTTPKAGVPGAPALRHQKTFGVTPWHA
jgi:hypothetical protein